MQRLHVADDHGGELGRPAGPSSVDPGLMNPWLMKQGMSHLRVFFLVCMHRVDLFTAGTCFCKFTLLHSTQPYSSLLSSTMISMFARHARTSLATPGSSSVQSARRQHDQRVFEQQLSACSLPMKVTRSPSSALLPFFWGGFPY